MSTRGKRASGRAVSALIFFFPFQNVKYNINLWLIGTFSLYKTDQKALLEFVSTHFLKAHLSFFVFFFLNSVRYSVLFYCSEILAV